VLDSLPDVDSENSVGRGASEKKKSLQADIETKGEGGVVRILGECWRSCVLKRRRGGGRDL